jgi:hypothetical protein
MCIMPVWVQYLQALATPAIALLAIIIGVMQWRTAHQRAVLDLFDRRMQVCDEIYAAIGEIMREGNVTASAIISFDKAVFRIPFLFGADVNLFLQKTRKQMIALRYAEVKTKSDNDEIRGKAADLAAKHMMDLTEFYGQFAILIGPYLKMHQKAPPF